MTDTLIHCIISFSCQRMISFEYGILFWVFWENEQLDLRFASRQPIQLKALMLGSGGRVLSPIDWLQLVHQKKKTASAWTIRQFFAWNQNTVTLQQVRLGRSVAVLPHHRLRLVRPPPKRNLRNQPALYLINWLVISCPNTLVAELSYITEYNLKPNIETTSRQQQHRERTVISYWYIYLNGASFMPQLNCLDYFFLSRCVPVIGKYARQQQQRERTNISCWYINLNGASCLR